MENRIVVENLVAGYGPVRVLRGVSVRVEPGETVVLLGSNGNGKSTLINAINLQVKTCSTASSPAQDLTWKHSEHVLGNLPFDMFGCLRM